MKKKLFGFALAAVLPALGCGGDNNGVGGLTSAIPTDIVPGNVCGVDLTCKKIVEVNGSVTGSVKTDAFFKATAKLKGQTAALTGEVDALLDEMAATIDVDLAGKAGVEAKATAIAASLKGGLDGKLEGGVKIDFQPPKCEVSAQASIQASAKCDVEVDPGKASVVCKGSCEVDASVEATCDASVSVPKCKGTAPSFACTGECHGSCVLNAAAECEGTCKGTCELDASGKCDGECSVAVGSDGKCGGVCNVGASGKCSTKCEGSCEITGSAKCEGECRGECTWDPGTVSCTGGDAKLTCEAKANASVMCNGTCKGEFEPPMVKADCQATAKAEASFDAECSPPSLRLDYAFKASLDAKAKLALQAKLEAFGKAFAKLSAKGAKIELIAKAQVDLAGTGVTAVQATLTAATKSSSFFEAKGAVCGVKAIGEATTILTDSGKELAANVKAIGSISTAVALK